MVCDRATYVQPAAVVLQGPSRAWCCFGDAHAEHSPHTHKMFLHLKSMVVLWVRSLQGVLLQVCLLLLWFLILTLPGIYSRAQDLITKHNFRQKLTSRQQPRLLGLRTRHLRAGSCQGGNPANQFSPHIVEAMFGTHCRCHLPVAMRFPQQRRRSWSPGLSQRPLACPYSSRPCVRQTVRSHSGCWCCVSSSLPRTASLCLLPRKAPKGTHCECLFWLHPALWVDSLIHTHIWLVFTGLLPGACPLRHTTHSAAPPWSWICLPQVACFSVCLRVPQVIDIYIYSYI